MIPATFSNISTSRIAACLSLIALTGCFNSKNDELKQWMVAERGNTVAQVEPVSEPKKFIPQAYDQASEISPFNNQNYCKLCGETPRNPVQAWHCFRQNFVDERSIRERAP